MKINSIYPIYNNQFKSVARKPCSFPRSLMCDSISFSSTKACFSGIDLMTINKFKAPIEKFNSDDDFQKWCAEKLDKEFVVKKDRLCASLDIQAMMQRQDIINEWINHLTFEDEIYPPSLQLLIIASITSDLKRDTNYLPPVLDKKVLTDTIAEITKNSDKDRYYNANFDKLYRKKLSSATVNEYESKTGWIVIPSETKDSDNFGDNVRKLKNLSHHNWCTRTYNSGLYLRECDIHIYLEDGKPKLAIRFCEDEIEEIQSEKNDSKIPLKYLDMVKSYLKDKKYSLSYTASSTVYEAERFKRTVEDIENKLKQKGVNFQTCSAKQLFDVLGYKYEENENGLLVLEKYHQPSTEIKFDDIGVDENRLLKDIVEINGCADFWHSNATNLGSIRKIGGNADFNNSEISDLANLECIKGYADFHCSKITNLKKLETIGGDAIFENSNISDLGKLKYIGGNAELTNIKTLKSLCDLQFIGGNLSMLNSGVEDLGKLQVVKGSIEIEPDKTKKLGSTRLKSVCHNFKI